MKSDWCDKPMYGLLHDIYLTLVVVDIIYVFMLGFSSVPTISVQYVVTGTGQFSHYMEILFVDMHMENSSTQEAHMIILFYVENTDRLATVTSAYCSICVFWQENNGDFYGCKIPALVNMHKEDNGSLS